MSIRVIIADDHKIVRDGLRALIESRGGMDLLAEAETGRAAVELATKLRPSVAVMDIGMPDLNGIEATRQIMASVPTVRVIALSMHADRRFVAGMLGAGASGYLLKDCAFEELADAIGIVASGRIYLSPSIAEVVVEGYVRHLLEHDREGRPGPDLSAREREVLQLLTEGRATKEAAARLHVSNKTIETHRHNIMAKLGIRSVAELTKYAIREGLTSLEG